jgi:tetratricopeptide (TPR) repeat protein
MVKIPMLFIPAATLKSRKSLLRDLDEGRITEEQACRKALELDPDDFGALLWLGQIHKDRGDLAGAEECFWKAVDANPWFWSSYISLVQVVPPDTFLSEGLFELGCRKLSLDEQAIASEEAVGLLEQIQSLADLNDLSKPERLEVFAEMLARRRQAEPSEVSVRLRSYRLIHELHAAADLAEEFVDDFIDAGSSIAPLLVGTVRGWTRSAAPDDTDHVIENTLALLGEIGDPAIIPYLLECLTLEDNNVCGAAAWALDRLMERHPREAAPVIGELIPKMDAAERIAISTRLLLHPAVDVDGRLMASLGENLGPVAEEDFDPFFPLLVSAMIMARGRAGVGLARQLLYRLHKVLPGNIRRKCERHIAAMEADADARAAAPAIPSPWTVYDICAGEAIWNAEEDEDDVPSKEELLEAVGDEDYLYVPEPIQRAPMPGRNDPCWCGSGKKYKKCHLDSDQHGDQPPTRVNGGAKPAGTAPTWNVHYGRKDAVPPSVFDPLRERIGRFLMDAVSEEDSALAMREFFGEDSYKNDRDHTMALLDWIVHDFTPPALGCRVIPEFLRRHGSSLSPKEREMLESWSRSVISLYEVQEVRAGVGSTFKNAFTNEIMFVHDISMSSRLVCGDGVLARVVEGDRGYEVTGMGFTVPQPQLAGMYQWMEDEHRASGLSWTEYLKHHWPRIRRKVGELHAQRFGGVQ